MNRRSLLKAIAAGSMTAMTPMASLLARSAMAAGEGPSQLKTLYIFHPNGAVPEIFFPTPGIIGNLPAMTAPMQGVAKHLLFLDGIGYAGGANTHEGGAAKCLTGFGGASNANGSEGISSIEVQMGKEDWANRSATKISTPSIQMGVGTQWGDNRNKRISFDGNKDLHAVDDPRILYPQLFAGGGATSSDLQLEILSRSNADLTRLKTQLGTIEKERLDQHGESLSVLEGKLRAATGGQPIGCKGPNISSVGTGGPDSALWRTTVLENISDIQQDIAIQALSCNLTRSIAFSYGVAVSPIVVPGTSTNDHDLSHQNAAAHTTSKIWWMAQIAKLIDKMSKTPDVNGSLLDNTIIVALSDLGHGNYHNHYRIPMFLAGGKNAGLVTGRSVDLRPYGTKKVIGDQNANDPSINHSDVLTTVAEKAGYKSIVLPTTMGRVNNVWVGGVSP